MNKINYQKILEKTLAEIASVNTTPKLLLHSCCAPCSSYVLEYLSDYFEITLLYYNPNIFPKAEFDYRLNEQRRLISELTVRNPIRLIEGRYEPQEFFDIAKGLEKIPEGGERCFKCYRLRMEEAASVAVKEGCDYFTTTLSISPLKNAEKINSIGEELEIVYGIKHLTSDFKKNDGYKRSIELSKEHNLYRQNYCGCIYSKPASTDSK